MWKNIFCLLIFFGFSIGCTSASTLTPIQQPTPQETVNTITPTKPALTIPPTSANSSFTEIGLTYQNKQVFGGHVDFQLLVKTSVYRMGILNLSNMEIQNEQPFPDSGISFPAISDDGVLFAQIIFQSDKKYLQVKNFLINEDILVELPDEAALLEWLNDKKLAIWGDSSHSECLNLLLIYDNSTAEIAHPLHPTPDLQIVECIQLPILTSDGTKMIYPWKMFDFVTGASMDVFSFMRNISEYSPAYMLREMDGTISIAYVEEDTLYYLLNTPLGEISKTDLTPEKTLLPGMGTKDYWWQPFTWISDQKQIGIDLISQDVDLGKVITLGQQVPTKFYLIDFAAHKIFDYDLDRAVFVEGSLPQTIRAGFPSPDGKYFAWTIYDSLSGLPIGSKILELSSGSILSISEIEILGWVVSKTE